MVAMSARGAIASDGEERKGESVSLRWAVLGAVRWRGVCVCSVRRVSIEAGRRLVLGPVMLRWSTISICLANSGFLFVRPRLPWLQRDRQGSGGS